MYFITARDDYKPLRDYKAREPLVQSSYHHFYLQMKLNTSKQLANAYSSSQTREKKTTPNSTTSRQEQGHRPRSLAPRSSSFPLPGAASIYPPGISTCPRRGNPSI